MVIFPFTLPIVRHRIERRVHPRREVQQFAPHLWMRFGKKAQIAAGGKYTADSLLRQGDVVGKKAYISSHWKAHTGLPPPQICQKNWLGLMPPLSRASHSVGLN